MENRKVNKSRPHLRKVKPRVLSRGLRGIPCLLIKLGVNFTKERIFELDPEDLLQYLSMMLSPLAYETLNKTQLKTLRRYLKKRGIKDYTEDRREKGTHSATTCKARR